MLYQLLKYYPSCDKNFDLIMILTHQQPWASSRNVLGIPQYMTKSDAEKGTYPNFAGFPGVSPILPHSIHKCVKVGR